MATNTRIIKLTDYTSILPYASEMFGVYQPLIGWKSKRVLDRMNNSSSIDFRATFKSVLANYKGVVNEEFIGSTIAHKVNKIGNIDISLNIGVAKIIETMPQNDSILLRIIGSALNESIKSSNKDNDFDSEKLKEIRKNLYLKTITHDVLVQILNDQVFKGYSQYYDESLARISTIIDGDQELAEIAKQDLEIEVLQKLGTESAISALLLDLVKNNLFEKIELIFYSPTDINNNVLENLLKSMKDDFKDPYLTFDPKNDVQDVSLSPIGIVHLYRQYFFELDTFLGTPVSHVWLSPGSSVELIETSSRRTTTEKTFETFLESTNKSEKSTIAQEEISDAVKQDNKEDTKLGFSTTVNQSWGTGNATATGSLNMDKTQQVAREQSQKRMRQQSEKLSTEIRQNFKSTFKTITEVSDTTSKRYVLNNTTQDLINYELRRKMRQVGVQIQDIGTYLCWETFVDEPGSQLGLPNLVNIAQPADLVIVPNPNEIQMPSDFKQMVFSGSMDWNFPSDEPQFAANHQENGLGGRFVPLNILDITDIPSDYEVYIPTDAQGKSNPFFEISKSVIAAGDDKSWGANNWGALGMITSDKKRIIVGITTAPGGLAWNKRITFKVSGTITCKFSDTKKQEILKANDAIGAAKTVANNENVRRQEIAYNQAVKDRIALASKITKRKFEDLREEERTIVYRNLIQSLMKDNYKSKADSNGKFNTQHILSELINSIFDIDKMLYFVAPEWWKPHEIPNLTNNNITIRESINKSPLKWPDQQNRKDDYFITENSNPAPFGSSLGWLLQLDGDDLRNAFLNAPWVKAVIPIRPGKEQAAINWLQNVQVEGVEGLEKEYAAPESELDAIRKDLVNNDPADPVVKHAHVTISDAIRKLCLDVAKKEEASKLVSKFPKEEIDDSNKVLATPIEKVFEHGFYPLKGGFKVKVEDDFEIISQWIEVLPTDQIVPIEVKYDPKTGKQI